MITRPLDIEARLSPAPRNFDSAFWLSALLAGLLFMLFFSRFVLVPGLFVDGGQGGFALPRVKGSPQLGTTTKVVVSFSRDEVIYFEGARIKPSELRQRLKDYARLHPREVLLLLADKQVSMQAVSDLCSMAIEAGFAGVVTGGEPLSSPVAEPSP